MALAAARMAESAMPFSCLVNPLHGGPVLLVRPRPHRILKRGQGIVKAVLGRGRDIFVAWAAGLVSIRKGRVSHNAFMGRLPV